MKRIACKIKGHKLSLIKKSNILIKEYTCVNCKQKFTTDGYGQIVKLTSNWKENNILFERILENRSA